MHALQAEVDGSIPALTLRRGGNEVVLRSQRLGATLQVDGDTLRAALTQLRVEYPSLELSGGLSLSPEMAELDMRAADVDVDSVRQVATLVAGEIPVVRAVVGVVQGGTAPQIRIHSKAASLGKLGGDQALQIQGRLVGGRVRVPGVDLDFEDVNGDATVTGGVLVGEQVSAQLGKSQATGGRLRVGLDRNTPELHVSTRVQADAAQMAALLKRLVANDGFQREFERISDVRGTVSGNLLLDGTTSDVAVTADASAFDVSGRVQGLRPPVRIEGGHFLYDTRGIEARDVTVTAGGSRLSEVALQILPKCTRSFEAAAGASHIALGEAYPGSKCAVGCRNPSGIHVAEWDAVGGLPPSWPGSQCSRRLAVRVHRIGAEAGDRIRPVAAADRDAVPGVAVRSSYAARCENGNVLRGQGGRTRQPDRSCGPRVERGPPGPQEPARP